MSKNLGYPSFDVSAESEMEVGEGDSRVFIHWEDLTGHIMAGFSFKSLGLRTVENVVPRDYLAMFSR